MSQVRAEVKLDHKTGPVTITITAATPEVAAYMANRLRELFSGKAKPSTSGGVFEDMLKGYFK